MTVVPILETASDRNLTDLLHSKDVDIVLSDYVVLLREYGSVVLQQSSARLALNCLYEF
jgi:hypothetical protein